METSHDANSGGRALVIGYDAPVKGRGKKKPSMRALHLSVAPSAVTTPSQFPNGSPTFTPAPSPPPERAKASETALAEYHMAYKNLFEYFLFVLFQLQNSHKGTANISEETAGTAHKECAELAQKIFLTAKTILDAAVIARSSPITF